MNNIFYNFYGFTVSVKSNTKEVLELLKKDFSYFNRDTLDQDTDLRIRAWVVDSLEGKVPENLKAIRQNVRAITYESDAKRYNDFYGKAVSIIDYAINEIEIFALSPGILHEVLYLAILSRETKRHDLKGLHKVHAFGVSKGSTALIGMMNMKGGKTTLFSYFIDQEGYELISDDTPLINWKGEILPFPIRVGFELNSFTVDRLEKYQEKSYHFEREEYAPKQLIDILEFRNEIASSKKKAILFQGVRVSGCTLPEIKRINRYRMWKYLVKHMVVGVGLPMVLEYYLESTWKDRFINALVLTRRGCAAIGLLCRSTCYEVYLGSDPEKNYLALKSLLDSYEE